eukprot:g33798.t1
MGQKAEDPVAEGGAETKVRVLIRMEEIMVLTTALPSMIRSLTQVSRCSRDQCRAKDKLSTETVTSSSTRLLMKSMTVVVYSSRFSAKYLNKFLLVTLCFRLLVVGFSGLEGTVGGAL